MPKTFQQENDDFESWLRTQCDVVEADIDKKRDRMRKSSFVFLRATFFRWARTIEAICPEMRDAPAVLSVGDTHVENFGTWRDAEGRLVWGINDFDEAAVIAYPYDLVRLATSARLAPDRAVANEAAATAILDGYRNGLADPRPVLLDEQESWMRPFVTCSDKDRQKFWQDVDLYPDATPPAGIARNLERTLPESASLIRFASRVKGGGGLGRARYLAVATWRGGRVVREAKALVPSAWDWAHGKPTGPLRFLDLAGGRFRSPDPFMTVAEQFVFRRIAADSRKIDLTNGTDPKLPVQMLRAMGAEIGSVHAATGDADAIFGDLAARFDAAGLASAARKAAASVEADYVAWTA